MSKAFTKEDSGDQDDDGGEESAELKLPAGQKNYMTPAGAARLKGELHELLTEKRPELVRTVSWAASNGDRSENGDYIYGKRRLREIDRRIRFLTKRLEASEIVDPAAQKTDRVLFGAWVTVERLSDDEDDQAGAGAARAAARKRTYRIVGIDEANASQGEISWISPMARALLNAKVGDVVTLKTPRGDDELEVLAIRYT